MKRFLILLVVTVFMFTIFVGCDNKGKDTTNSSNGASSELTSEELKEWWSNVILEIEEGDESSQTGSTAEGSNGSSTSTSTSTNTNSGNTTTSSSATGGGIEISGGSNTSSSSTTSTTSSSTSSTTSSTTSSSTSSSTGNGSSNPATSEDESLGNESYVPTEKDEGFGKWV